MLVAMGLLGVAGWWLSDAPRAVAGVASLLGLAWSLHLARHEAMRASVLIVIRGDAAADVDGIPVDDLDIAWRGPLVTLGWSADGRRVRRLAFPDALDGTARRALRLQALRREDAPEAAVAP